MYDSAFFLLQSLISKYQWKGPSLLLVPVSTNVFAWCQFIYLFAKAAAPVYNMLQTTTALGGAELLFWSQPVVWLGKTLRSWLSLIASIHNAGRDKYHKCEKTGWTWSCPTSASAPWWYLPRCFLAHRISWAHIDLRVPPLPLRPPVLPTSWASALLPCAAIFTISICCENKLSAKLFTWNGCCIPYHGNWGPSAEKNVAPQLSALSWPLFSRCLTFSAGKNMVDLGP